MLSVSIIMPMYNAAAYIESAIESVLAQTYSSWELIIVDDCSTDASATIVEKFLADSRIHLLKNTVNSGAVVSRNKAIDNAAGEIIAFLDSDDCWYPQKLEKQIAEYDLHPQTALVFCNYEHMDARGHRLNKVLESPAKVTYHTLLKSNCIGCLTATYNRVLLGKRFFMLKDMKITFYGYRF